jgi:hypothetical protein
MATFCDMAYTWDANKYKNSETITGVMSGYGFTSGGTIYDFPRAQPSSNSLARLTL